MNALRSYFRRLNRILRERAGLSPSNPLWKTFLAFEEKLVRRIWGDWADFDGADGFPSMNPGEPEPEETFYAGPVYSFRLAGPGPAADRPGAVAPPLERAGTVGLNQWRGHIPQTVTYPGLRPQTNPAQTGDDVSEAVFRRIKQDARLVSQLLEEDF